MKYIAFALVLVVLAAGCIGGQKVRIDENNGLVINDFSIDPAEVESGRPFRIFLEVENVGGTTARDVKAFLFGASWVPNSATLEKWGNRIIGPPDVLTQSPGGTLATSWDATVLGPAPLLPEGVVHTFKLTGRVTYNYSTSAVVNIPMFNEEEFLRKKKIGELIDATLVVSNTNAPIKVAIEGTSPVVVRNPFYDGLPQEEVFYRIHFLNVGSGIPITEAQTGQELTGLVGGTIILQGDGLRFKECLGATGTNIVQIPRTEQGGALIRGASSAIVPCTISVDRALWQTKPQGTATLVFDLEYKYFVDKEASLTVIGRRRGGIAPSAPGGIVV